MSLHCKPLIIYREYENGLLRCSQRINMYIIISWYFAQNFHSILLVAVALGSQPVSGVPLEESVSRHFRAAP